MLNDTWERGGGNNDEDGDCHDVNEKLQPMRSATAADMDRFIGASDSASFPEAPRKRFKALCVPTTLKAGALETTNLIASI